MQLSNYKFHLYDLYVLNLTSIQHTTEKLAVFTYRVKR